VGSAARWREANAFPKIVDTLRLDVPEDIADLAHVFLPYFSELGQAAEKALNLLDRIIKLPLGQRSERWTRGERSCSAILSTVFRRSCRSRGSRSSRVRGFGVSNMVSDWWHRFRFLFGTTERHPIELRPGVFKIQKSTTDGVFQPFIDWFNRHHFTQQGIKIGQQILAGVLNSGMRNRLVTFFGQVFRDAALRAGQAVLHTLNQPLGPGIAALAKKGADAMYQLFLSADHKISSSIKNAIGSAFDWVKDHVSSVWSSIVSIIEQPFHINIDWPSPPSWLGAITGAFGSSGNHPPKGSTGSTNPVAQTTTSASFRPAMARDIHIHVHGADLSDAPTRRRIAQQLGKAIANDWRTRAAGH
jgi:hypothetical protein